MAKPMVVGNWKMNTTVTSAVALSLAIVDAIPSRDRIDIVICPPVIAIDRVSQEISDSPLFVGAQDLYPGEFGSFTGAVSSPMLETMCSYVIVGHSERRQIMHESNDLVRLKLQSALDHGIIPILCVGETFEQRRSGNTMNIISTQVMDSTEDLTPNQLRGLVIAYEPVWAIGSGAAATPEIAQEIMLAIRNNIAVRLPDQDAANIQILYGGSVSTSNAGALAHEPDVDGVLVGGASLKPAEFIEICHAFATIKNRE
jgi:triosephosphate isomerase